MSESTVEKVGATETVSNEKAQNTFSTAMIISGIRCAFTYVIFPILAPVLGVASGVGVRNRFSRKPYRNSRKHLQH